MKGDQAPQQADRAKFAQLLREHGARLVADATRYHRARDIALMRRAKLTAGLSALTRSNHFKSPMSVREGRW